MKTSLKLLALAIGWSFTLFHVSAATTVVQAAGGGAHTLFVTSDGSLWTMGDNELGQLGQGASRLNTNVPMQVAGVTNATAVAAGFNHSLFIKSDGTLWAMGQNDAGQLGDGTTTNRFSPVQTITTNAVTDVAGGGHQTIFRTVRTSGTFPHQTVTINLMGMGDNQVGELGDTTFSNRSTPVVVRTVSSSSFIGLAPIAEGFDFSLFLETDDSLWGMGENLHGQLGTLVNPTNQPIKLVPGIINGIAAGEANVLFIKSDGTLWAFGDDNDGQLGDGTTSFNEPTPEQVWSNAVAVASGGGHSLFIQADGSLWGMGDNTNGQLGTGTGLDSHVPIRIISSNVVSIATGDLFSLFINSDGSLWAMGDNTHGQLGDGFTNLSSLSPEQIFPRPQPAFTGAKTVSRTNLQLTATCLVGGTYHLLAGTNLAQPLSQWTPVSTNLVISRGTNNFALTLTNAVTSGFPQRFFVLSQ